MKDLSILILSYNTEELTQKCLNSLYESLKDTSLKSEIIVVDNNSSDNSVQMLEKIKKAYDSDRVGFTLILNKDNTGFTGGNNQALEVATGKYVLYLNSDVIIDDVDFPALLKYMDENADVAGLTVRVVLPTGMIDPASHRGFPTPWNAFSYFLKLEKLSKNIPFLNKIFGGYHLTHLDLNTIHEIDAPAAAFYLSRKDVLDKLGGFDAKSFFAYGEDIDLTYRTKQLGYKVMYYPKYTVTHFKWSSGLKNKSPEIRKKTRTHFNQAMKIFYKKHYEKKYPAIVNALMYFFMDLKNKIS
jgi:GT2 family glycosyltransferase